jgi:predicted DNA binding CopG/RHH family protein
MFTTTLPSDLLKRLRDRASADGLPLNYYVTKGLRIVVDGETP